MKELQFLIYRAENDQEKASVIVSDETIWASQKEMARLFDVGVPAISKHLKNIFEEGELDEGATISKMETTASDGKNYLANHSFYMGCILVFVGCRRVILS